MKLLERALGIRPRANTPGPLEDFWYRPASWSLRNAAGVPVSSETAHKLSTVWRCVSILAGSVASLPLVTYRRLPDGGKERAVGHPLYGLLHDSPNGLQTSYAWRQTMTRHLVLRGNAYSRIYPGPRGAIDRLLPLHPDRVRPEPVPGDPWALRYHVRADDGGEDTLLDDEVFHLRGPSEDGRVGMDLITYAANTVGLGLAQDEFAGRFYSQAPLPSVYFEHPGTLSDGAQRRLRQSIQTETAGLANAHKVRILEEGMRATHQPVGLTAQQAAIVESREFTVADVARWFGVPLHMVGETTKETSWGTGIEQMSIGFVVYTLMPWLVNWEQQISLDLIMNNRTYFAQFVLDALLRGDAKSRAEALDIQRRNGALNADEWRELENRNALPDGLGQAYWMPANMVEVGAEPAPTGPPAPPAVPPPPAPVLPPDRAREAAIAYEPLLAQAIPASNGVADGGH